MNKIEIFEDVVKLMKEDSATCKDIKGADSKPYREKITDDMSDMDFVYLMSSYMATFGLTGHLKFTKKGMGCIPFRVQRYQDELYIVETYTDAIPMKAGDIIIRIDGSSVKEFCDKHSEFFYNQVEERQSVHWGFVLRFAEEILWIDKNGNENNYKIELGDYESQLEKYYFKQLRDDVALIKLADFENEQEIVAVYEKHKEAMDSARYLIIDVRNNGGGTDTAFLPLIRYCIPEGVACKDVKLKPDEFSGSYMEINFSKRNCEIRKRDLEQYLGAGLPEETKAIFGEMMADLDNNSGKGFVKTVEDDEDDDSLDLPFVGDTKVEKVFVITDGDCGSSGDNCVRILGAFPKTTVVGRPTMGILDYSNVAIQQYGDFRLMYPTSRMGYIDNGVLMMKSGVKVDEYIPWTPEHLVRDVDVEYIMEKLV